MLLMFSCYYWLVYSLDHMWKWLPETCPPASEKRNMLSAYYSLLSNARFDAYLLMLIGGLEGVVVFFFLNQVVVYC